MKVKVKCFVADVDAKFKPDASNEFMFLLCAYVGLEDLDEHKEQFQILVCSPEWLRAKVKKEGPLFGRMYLVVERFDLPMIEKYVADYVSGIPGDDWNTVATRLSRVSLWEFEDYNNNTTKSVLH